MGPPPRGGIGRADLLRLLAESPRDRLALEHDASGWYGYIRAPLAPPEMPARETRGKRSRSQQTEPARKLPLRLDTLHGILSRESLPEAPESHAETLYPAPLQPGDPRTGVASTTCLAVDQDLIPRARLLPMLRAWLAGARAAGLDLPRLAREIAELKAVRRLPRRRARRWDPDLVVVFDFSDSLWPYRHDMLRLRRWLAEECGRHAVSMRVVENGPPGKWHEWGRKPRRQHDWIMPPAGAKVLIVGDLGQFTPGAAVDAWLTFIAGLRRAGCRPLALCPIGANQVDPELAGALPMLRWSPDARPRRQSAPAGATEPAGLDELLAMVAVHRRVDPALLRALRQIAPSAPRDAGLEGAVWNHPEVRAGAAADLNGAIGRRHLARFENLPLAVQARARALGQRDHAHLRAVLRHEETLQIAWRAHPELRGHMQAEVTEARQFYGALVNNLNVGQEDWRHVVADVLARADASQVAGDDLFQDLASACYGNTPAAAIPDWVDPRRLETRDLPSGSYWLAEDTTSGRLILTPETAARQSLYGAPLTLASLLVRIGDAPYRQRLIPNGQTLDLGEPQRHLKLRLDTGHESLLVGPVRRPRGAAGWGRDPAGWFVDAPPIGDYRIRFDSDRLIPQAAEPDDPDPRAHLRADPVEVWRLGDDILRVGIDAPFGLYADLEIAGVTQRLRWIEPGEFRMGSPDDEPEHMDREGPRHRVLISQGYWLADTACTQGLWRAVMGDNPSRFTDGPEAPSRPVETVSWDEVQGFLARMDARLPGARAELPSEAEWEYACRAGTETPFSFGADITPEQVNYDGSYPYAGGKKGLYRATTVPVKSLPANPWGLYEMHGNVWEWCADDLRDYRDRSETDPRGAEGKGVPLRVVRGGSWYSGGARRARAAYRNRYERDDRAGILGFRFALRSIEPGRAEPAGPAPEGLAGVEQAARSAAARGKAAMKPRPAKKRR